MRRGFNLFGLMLLVLFVSISLTTGCAKKAAIKDGAGVSQVQQAVVPQTAVKDVAPKATTDDAAARERALREQALREAAEKAAREAAAKEAAAKAAMLKELQIADINFDYDKYNLKPEAQDILKKAAPAYLKYGSAKLVVEGHCDERGTVEYNLALGEKRANEAAKFLVDLGIAKDRIKTISYGEENPLDKGSNEVAWAKNRRAHFVVNP
ncbi:MAG: OmpA family protein [Syntrophobacterales bacterium]|nr:OmpA family protein [Syntrophobacterales bacterium]